MRGFVQNTIVRGADRLGYSVMANWRTEKAALAAHLRRLFELYSIDCVVDVGANRGQYGLFLRREVGYRGLIVSVEPVPANCADLRRRAAQDPLWQVHEEALGAEPGRLPINVTYSDQMSSFLQPDNSRAPEFAGINRTVDVVEVPVSTADALLDRVRATQPVTRLHLKLDTQGYDLEVMRGLRAADGLVHTLQSEMSVVPLYAGMPDHVSAAATLAARGFELSGMFPISMTTAMQLVEYDCVMVRAGRLPAAAAGG